jgi:hypothetical protein
MFHYRVHNRPPLIPILRQMNPVYKLAIYFPKFHYNINLPSRPRSYKWSLSFRFFNQNIVCIYLSHPCYMPHPSRPFRLDHLNNIWWSVQVMNLLIMQCSPATSSVSILNILLGTLFSYTLNVYSFVRLRDQVSHPDRTTGKFMVLYVLIFMLLETRRKDSRSWNKWQQAWSEYKLILNSSWMAFWFVTVVPKCFNCATFFKG